MARTCEFEYDEVLDKAMNMFWAKGYEATSMSELEKGIGINKFSIYNTFGNKHSLFLAALKRYEDKMVNQLVSMLTDSNEGLTAIELSLDFLEETMLEQSEHIGCFMLNSGTEMSAHDPEVAKRVQNMNRKLEDAFYQALAIAQQKKEISKDLNLLEYSRFLLILYQGMVTVAKVEQDIRTTQSSIKFVKHLFSKL